MATFSVLVINHDLIGNATEHPETFVKALLQQLSQPGTTWENEIADEILDFCGTKVWHTELSGDSRKALKQAVEKS